MMKKKSMILSTAFLLGLSAAFPSLGGIDSASADSKYKKYKNDSSYYNKKYKNSDANNQYTNTNMNNNTNANTNNNTNTYTNSYYNKRKNIAVINQYKNSDAYYYNNTWYVELEEVIEGFGGRYSYNKWTDTATATLYGQTIQVQRNATTATIADKSVAIGGEALCLDDGYLDYDMDADDLYVPISFVQNGLNASVNIETADTGYGFQRTVIAITKNDHTNNNTNANTNTNTNNNTNINTNTNTNTYTNGYYNKWYGKDYWKNIAIINQYKDSDVYYYNNTWYVELEEVIEGFGGRYSYNKWTDTATATLYGQTIQIQRNATTATIAGKSVAIGGEALCLDDGYLDYDMDADDLYVPISFVQNGLNASVNMETADTGYGFQRTVITITKNNQAL